jgi:hypothetical protein
LGQELDLVKFEKRCLLFNLILKNLRVLRGIMCPRVHLILQRLDLQCERVEVDPHPLEAKVVG